MIESDEMPSELAALKQSLDSPGPALPLSAEREQALIDAALASSAGPLLVPRRSRALAGAVAVVAAAAVAALGVLAWRASAPAPVARTSPVASAAAPVARSPSAPSQAVSQPASPSQPAPVVDSPSAPAEPAASPVPVARSATPTASSEPLEEADLLKQANDLRRTGDFAGAERLYRQVIARYPQTASAYVAMSSVASLLLGRDASAAAEMYRAARRAQPSGSLDLEIRQGLARAYRKQGQAAAERRELEDLVARYPNADASERARARLAELRGSRP